MGTHVELYEGKPWGHRDNCACSDIKELRVMCDACGKVVSYPIGNEKCADDMARWHESVCKRKVA